MGNGDLIGIPIWYLFVILGRIHICIAIQLIFAYLHSNIHIVHINEGYGCKFHWQIGRNDISVQKSNRMLLYTSCFTSNAFFGPGSNFAERNPKFLKIGLTLPDKKVFKIFWKRGIIWQRFQSSVLNIFRHRFWKLANFSLASAYISVAYKIKSV